MVKLHMSHFTQYTKRVLPMGSKGQAISRYQSIFYYVVLYLIYVCVIWYMFVVALHASELDLSYFLSDGKYLVNRIRELLEVPSPRPAD
jgi:hypothetical protein